MTDMNIQRRMQVMTVPNNFLFNVEQRERLEIICFQWNSVYGVVENICRSILGSLVYLEHKYLSDQKHSVKWTHRKLALCLSCVHIKDGYIEKVK